jgi:hypothetical protein
MGTLHPIKPQLAAPAQAAAPLLFTEADMEAARREAVRETMSILAEMLRAELGTPLPLSLLSAVPG